MVKVLDILGVIQEIQKAHHLFRLPAGKVRWGVPGTWPERV